MSNDELTPDEMIRVRAIQDDLDHTTRGDLGPLSKRMSEELDSILARLKSI